MNLLGYGNGGDKSLVDIKDKAADKPEWWNDDNNFEKFTHPSKAKRNVNEDVISAILHHYGYDVKTHCAFLSQNEQENHIASTSKVLGESILEEDPAILELGIAADMDNNTDIETANQIKNVVQRIQRKCQMKNYVEESDEEEIPKKKKKHQVPRPNFHGSKKM